MGYNCKKWLVSGGGGEGGGEIKKILKRKKGLKIRLSSTSGSINVHMYHATKEKKSFAENG